MLPAPKLHRAAACSYLLNRVELVTTPALHSGHQLVGCQEPGPRSVHTVPPERRVSWAPGDSYHYSSHSVS